MPCNIQIRSVNGIVPSGQSAPTLLRVTGDAALCQGGQVLITSSITAPTGPVNVDPTWGRFRADIPITGSASCGGPVQVTVTCASNANCFDQASLDLPCCEIPQLFFDAEVPMGSLAPTQLRVQGTLLGCPTDQVVVSSSVTGTSQPTPVDQYTGGFSVLLPITSSVQCDEPIAVTAACASSPSCTQTTRGPLACLGCYHATITQSAQPCAGNPATQPVALNATINLPAGDTLIFEWDFGDGQTGQQFTVDNSAGTATTAYTNTETHNYAPGTYTATLKIVGPHECPEVSVTVVAQCQGCPTVAPPTVTIADTCVNGKRTVTLDAQLTAIGSQAVIQWDYGDGSGFGPGTVVNAGPPFQYTQPHDYAPGTYTAKLKTILPSGCPDVPVQVSVPPCDVPPCTLLIQDITLQVGACNPATGTRTVTASAVLNNSDPADLYSWQWDSSPSQSSLPAPQGTTQQHDYPAPGSGPTTETIKLVVMRGSSCIASLQKQVTIDPCGATCPTITAITDDAPGTCTADRSRRTVNLNATIGGSGVSQYTWDFGDGSAQQSIPGSAGAATNHAFLPGTYTLQLTATGPGNCQTSLSKQITVTACCPQVTGISVSQGTCAPGASQRPVTLTAQVQGTGFTEFEWDFGDGTGFGPPGAATAPSHAYSPGTHTASVIARAPRCPDSSASTTFTVASCRDGGGDGGMPSCAILLWLALILMLVGALMVLVGCVIMVPFAVVAFWLQLIGWILFGVGWLLFIFWLIFCSAFTACRVILAVRAFVMVLIGVFAIISIVLSIIGGFVNPAIAVCALFSWAYTANWGLLLLILDKVAEARGCITLNPSGSSPAGPAGPTGSSGSSLRSVQSASDQREADAKRDCGCGD